MNKILTCFALVFICMTIICCGPNSILQHVQSVNPKATIVPIRGTVSESWGALIATAFKDDKCKMVVLWVESPGGNVKEVKLLEHRIKLLKQQYPKPFLVFSERLIASGAYWLACLADSIFVSPVAQCGSIGVTSTRIDATKCDSLAGIRWYIFRSGDLKGAGDPHIPMSKKEASIITYEIIKIYNEFVNVIIEHRGDQLDQDYDSIRVQRSMPFNEFISNITQGSIYNANVARTFGLVDNIMWFDEFIVYLRNMGFKVSTMRDLPVRDFYPTGVIDSLFELPNLEMIFKGSQPILKRVQ